MKTTYTLIAVSLLCIVLGFWWLSRPMIEPLEDPVQTYETQAEEGSEAWCEHMMDVPGEEWSEADIRVFAEHCLLD